MPLYTYIAHYKARTGVEQVRRSNYRGFHGWVGPRFGADFLAGRISCAKEKHTYIAAVTMLNRAADRFRHGRGTDCAASKMKED